MNVHEVKTQLAELVQRSPVYFGVLGFNGEEIEGSVLSAGNGRCILNQNGLYLFFGKFRLSHK